MCVCNIYVICLYVCVHNNNERKKRSWIWENKGLHERKWYNYILISKAEKSLKGVLLQILRLDLSPSWWCVVGYLIVMIESSRNLRIPISCVRHTALYHKIGFALDDVGQLEAHGSILSPFNMRWAKTWGLQGWVYQVLLTSECWLAIPVLQGAPQSGEHGRWPMATVLAAFPALWPHAWWTLFRRGRVHPNMEGCWKSFSPNVRTVAGFFPCVWAQGVEWVALGCQPQRSALAIYLRKSSAWSSGVPIQDIPNSNHDIILSNICLHQEGTAWPLLELSRISASQVPPETHSLRIRILTSDFMHIKN